MTRDRALFLSLLAAGCFLVMAVIGFTYSPNSTPTPAPTQTPVLMAASPTPVPPLGAQANILLAGADSLSAPHPQLEWLWVLSYVPGLDTFYLVGFAPALRVRLPGDAAEHTLAEVFAAGPVEAQGSLWLQQALQTLTPGLQAQGEVDFDRRVASEAVNRLGGLTVGGTTLTGSAALASVEAAGGPNSAAGLQQQGEILRALLARDWSGVEARPLFSLGQQWYPSVDWFLESAHGAPQLTGMDFRITVYPAVP